MRNYPKIFSIVAYSPKTLTCMQLIAWLHVIDASEDVLQKDTDSTTVRNVKSLAMNFEPAYPSVSQKYAEVLVHSGTAGKDSATPVDHQKTMWNREIDEAFEKIYNETLNDPETLQRMPVMKGPFVKPRKKFQPARSKSRAPAPDLTVEIIKVVPENKDITLRVPEIDSKKPSAQQKDADGQQPAKSSILESERHRSVRQAAPKKRKRKVCRFFKWMQQK